MKFALIELIILMLITSSCNRMSEVTEQIAPQPSPTPSHPPEKIDADLERTITGIAEAARGKVGVGALLLETGDAAYLNRNDHFAMQSVYKLPIAMAVGQVIDKGSLKFDSDISITPADYVRRGFHSPIRNLNPRGTVMRLDDVIRYSISESDGSANDVLLNLAGGPQNVQQYLASIGITDMMIANSTKEISRDWDTQYRNYASPEASVNLLKALIDRRAGLSERTTTLIFDSLLESDTGRHRIHRGLPEGATLAHKTGTGGHPSEVPGYRPPANANVSSTLPDRSVASGVDKRAFKRSSQSDQGSNNLRSTVNTRPVNSPRKGRTLSSNKDIDSEESDVITNEVTSATNDIGIINLPDGRHIILAVYVQDSVADGPTREKVIADIARAVCARWTTGQLMEISSK
jgi:beta-lactamase class A